MFQGHLINRPNGPFQQNQQNPITVIGVLHFFLLDNVQTELVEAVLLGSDLWFPSDASRQVLPSTHRLTQFPQVFVNNCNHGDAEQQLCFSCVCTALMTLTCSDPLGPLHPSPQQAPPLLRSMVLGNL